MTTIVCRDGILAGDSRLNTLSSDDDVAYFSNVTKVFKLTKGPNKGHVVGLAGDMSAALIFLNWYATGGRSERPERDDSEDSCNDFEALILRPDGVFCIDDHLVLMRMIDPFVAIGNGAAPAIAAMHCGKSAIEAVKIAALCDSATGGPIMAYSLTSKEPLDTK